MIINEIENKLLNLGVYNVNFDKLHSKILSSKQVFVSKNLQNEAKKLWIYEQIITIHKEYNLCFKLLKEKSYYSAWCKLETIEIYFSNLQRHFSYNETKYKLFHIEKSVKNLQTVYPYRLFTSHEIVEKETKCSVCDKKTLIRNNCGHKVGEIYNGKMCHKIVTDFEVLGFAIVENPVDKYTVLFSTDPNTNKKKDQYNYAALDYFISVVSNPYEPWDLIVHDKYLPHENFKNHRADDYCPCNSSKKYGECCLEEKGIKYLHYEYIVKIPLNKQFFSNTLKYPKTTNLLNTTFKNV